MKRILNHIVQNVKSYVRSNFVHPKALVNAGFLLLMILIAGVPVKTRAQALYSQDFNFTGTLTSNGWTAHSGGGTNALSTTTGLTYNGHAGSGIGNAALVNNLGGEDANQTFTATPSTAYYSFLVNVTDIATSKTGDYFFNVGSPGGAAWTAYSGRVFARIVSGNVNFGISNTGTATYGTTNFSKNTTYLIVVKHTIVTGTSADPLSMWVIPSGMPATEAAAGTAEVVNSATNGTDAISAVALRQGSATTAPQAVVDAIRVGANWSDVVPQAGSAPTAQVSNITFSSPTSSSVSVSWTNGNGTGRIVKINTSNSFTSPVSGTTYSGNAVYGGTSEQVVYAGTGSSFSLSGLSPGQAYFLRAYEYNSTGMLYNLFSETNNPNSTTLSYPVPTATQITPNSAFAGASSFSLTFNGTNVYPASVIEWNGVAKTTSYVNSTTLTATIPASDIASAGTATVTVRNPAPGGGVSSGLTFTINASTTPLISVSATLSNFISPAGTPSASQSYTVAGSNLTDGITITPPAGFEIRTGIDSFSFAPITLPLAGSNYPTSFTVEVDQKDASHPNFGIGYPSGYILNSVQGPTLTLVRGTTYRFYFDGQGTCCSSTLGHPFVFTSSAVGGGANSGDVISAGVIQYGDSTYFTPDVSTPDSLYYMCDVHQSMGGSINVINPTAGSISATTIDVRFNPGASGTYSGNIDHSSIGATTENVAVTGFAIESEPTNSSAISFGAIDGNSIVVNTSGGNGASRIIVIRSASTTTYTPSDGAAVNGVNANFTTALDQGSGNKIVYDGSGNTVTVTGLLPLTTYHFSVFEYNGSGVTSNYSASAATANTTTLSTEPSTSSTVTISRIKADTAIAALANGNGVKRMMVMSTSPVTFVPVDGTVYIGASANLATAVDLGSGNYLMFNDSSVASVTIRGLSAGTTYYVRTYEFNGSGVSTNYRISTFGNVTFTMPSNIPYNGGAYTQDFNGLPNTGSFGMTGFGLGPYYLSTPAVNAVNLTGWQYSSLGGTGLDVVFAAENGSTNTGGVKSYGAASSSNRALGSLATGTSVPVFGAVFVNNTAGPLNKVTINYTGQQWRNGGTGTPNQLLFSYKLGGSGILDSSFTSVSSLNFNNPVSGGTAANLDGTLPANQTALAFTFTLNGNWMPGQTLVIRWADNNDAGNDEGLAIDDLSFSAQGPSTPLLQDSLITFANVLTTSMDVNWTAGDANNRIVVINTTNSFTPPVDGNNYTANAVYSGSGEQVVYNGTGNVVSVSGLTAGTTYYFRVFGYNGSGASSKYSISTAQDNPLSQTTAAPSAATKLVITSVNGGNYPVDNTPFNVIVQAQDSAGSPQTVSVNTTVSLSVFSGFGLLGGNTTGVINAGSSTVTITGVTYTPEDFAVQLQADAVSGETLASGFSSIFDVLGVATQLSFTTTPAAGIINNAVTSIEVTAFRTDFTTDVNYTSAVTLTKLSGPGNIIGTTTVNCVAGVATFSGISFDQPGVYTLQASSGGLSPATSLQITITLVPVVTELVVPKFIAAKTAAGSHNARVPFAVCLKIDNLVPNTAYDLKAGVGTDTTAATSYGSGNIWTGAGTTWAANSISSAFTTDANGSSGPIWVHIQPTANSSNSRFASGFSHNLRVGFVISGGLMPSAPQFVGTKLMTALDVGVTAQTPATTDDGAFLKGSSVNCIGGKYVFLYDNIAGTGDPLSVYQSRTMLAPNTVSQTELPALINDVFLNTSTNPAGDYGAVLPIGGNNVNGVRRIEVRNADNTIFNSVTDADGIWGAVNTTSLLRRDVAVLTESVAQLNTLSITTSTSGESCTGANDGTASVTVVAGATPISYSWNTIPVQTTATANGLAAGNYTVTVSDSKGCSQQATVTVAAPASTTITASGPLTFCNGGSVTLTVNAAQSYLWSNGETTQSITATSSGSYAVTVTTGTCVATSLPVFVTVNNYVFSGAMFSENMGSPTGTVSVNTFTGWQNTTPVTFSAGTSGTDVRITTISSGYSGASGGGNVFFGTSGGNTKTFTISGINTTGYSSLTLTFGLLRSDITNGMTLETSTDGVNFTPVSFTQPTVSNTWQLITVSSGIPATTNLRLRFSKTASTSFRLDDVKITGTTSTPIVTALGSTSVCGSGSVMLMANIGSGIQWTFNGTSTKTVTVNATGSYTFTATGTNGCSTTASPVSFTVNPEPTAQITSGTINCNGGTTTISVTAANGTDPYTGTGNFTVGAGTYSYIVTDANGCDDTTGVTITQPALITGSQAASACDSYVWSLNGQTYTSSGNYNTIVPAANGCDSIVTLQLIITPSNTNSTSASACDAYTWSYNGQTYTTSGSYTSVTGCHTEILNLTINPSSLNVVSETACGSYTWTLNGQTYTASGSYTSVTGCNTEVLNLTINAVSVNTDTVIVCTSYTWAANGQTYTQSGNYTSVSGCNTEILDLTIQTCGNVTLNLSLLIEGYYDGNGGMVPVLFNSGVGSSGTETDTIMVELRDPLNTGTIVASASAVINTSGLAVLTYPLSVSGSSYYIAVNHRNAVQTWSADPVLFSSNTSYNFSTAATQAYGSNMKEVSAGVFAFYSGDIAPQDGVVDITDQSIMDNDIFNFGGGYMVTDVSGDGVVDITDQSVLDNNIFNFVGSFIP